MDTSPTHAALFVDYENIYYYISNRNSEDSDSSLIANTTIRKLKQSLLDDHNKQCIVQHAYADFERIEENAQGSLYLIGIETHNVLGTDHKNAADMRLCIDALETLYVRPEISTFVIVAGDRDYIPVVQHLRKHAKSVLVVSFKGSVSGDLLQVAEERNFIDAHTMLPEGTKLEEQARELRAPGVSATRPSKQDSDATSDRPSIKGPKFPKPRLLEAGDELDAVRIMLEHFREKPEIWMTPYLHRQRSVMPHLADFERRALITTLAEKGAIAVEKRPGEPAPYSVIIVNWDHPSVRELCDGT